MSENAESQKDNQLDPAPVEMKPEPSMEASIPRKSAVMFSRALVASGLLFLMVVFALGWHRHHVSWKPKGFDLMVEEITSVGDFRKVPVTSNFGQHLWYARNSEHGVGLYHADLETLARRKVVAVEVVDRGGDYFNIFGWSPDDRHVLFTETADSKETGQQAILCDGSDFSFISVFDMPDRIEEGVWITTNSFVLLDRAKNLYLCNHRPEPLLGANGQERVVKLGKLQESEAGFLMAMDDTHLGYQEQGNLRRLDLANGKSEKVNRFDIAKNQTCQWVNYSRNNGQFLFTRADPSKNSGNLNLYRFNPKGKTYEESLTQLSNGREYVMNGRWIQNGTGHAYVSITSGISQISVRTRDKNLHTNLFVEGHVRAFAVSPDGEKLFAVASEQNEPQSIWEYSIKEKQLRCIVAGIEKPFQHSQVITPLRDSVKASDGRTVPYYMLPPRDFDHHKQYPVVIDGPSESRWQPHSQLLANMGIYYVSVSRRGLASSDDLSDGAKDMLAMYDHLARNPNVDTNRIFIMGFSDSTLLVRDLAQNWPEKWAGLILNGPVDFPHPEDPTLLPKIFISIGEEDSDWRLENVKEFESFACQNHISLQIAYSKDAGHIFSSIGLMRERIREIASFVLKK